MAQTYRGAGINGYIYQLLRHLPAAVSAGSLTPHLIAYLHDPAFATQDGLAVEVSRWNTRSPWQRIAWEQTRLAALSRGLDLLHGLAYAAPLASACPTVITVHDLSFIRFPAAFRPFNRIYLSFITRQSTRRAAGVIAVSESTRQDVMHLCGVPGERVTVVPNGVTPEFRPAEPTEVEEFCRRKGLPAQFILFLGTLEPRKNLVRLIQAYARWRASAGPEAKLVIAGGKGWFYQAVFSEVARLGLQDDVIFPGFVPADELPWWYRAAALFVYPSLFEGFGLPVLEAMACATPVITSTVSSLPETAGDAALKVDPEDVAGLADAIAYVMGSPAAAEELREAGLRQAARFSWTRTAAETAVVYANVAGRHRLGGAG